MASTSGNHLSKEFFELIKAIGESRSKQEEDRIITREVVILKNKLNPWKKQSGSGSTNAGMAGGGPNGSAPSKPIGPLTTTQNPNFSSKKKSKEFLVRLLYVEMLGHDGSFGYIKAVEMAANTSITHKRTGYLLCGSCLSPENEFRFMLVNQMQRDLSSSNVLENCAALLAVTRIITADMVPAVAGDVGKLLAHASETVRKKAIIALHRLHQLNNEAVPPLDFIEKLRRVLCDRDPAVMGASLCVIESMATIDPMPFKDLVSSLVSILKQICEHRLPSEFDYHRMPAPWMQMAILRILSVLCRGDANASSDCYEVISDCLKRADVGANAGYAVVYECVRTITKLYPNPTLLDAAAEAISRFIESRSHNLKYLGVTGLASIVEQHPQYAAAHQMAVIECLEDRDETLQRRTLELLYKMTNPVNVEFITDKLLAFLRETTDPFLKQDLTVRITKIAERYAPSQEWYIQSITSLFEISGDLVSPEVAHNLMSLIAEGQEDEDEEANMTLRQNAVELYASLLNAQPNRKLPKLLAETVAWVLGEYAYLSTQFDLSEILSMLCDLSKRGIVSGGTGALSNPATRKFVATAAMKLVAQLGTCPPGAAHVIDDCAKSSDVDLQQRCLEFQNLLTSASHVLGDILPVDASCEDIQADENLSFLDGFVAEARGNGAMPYSPPEEDDEEYDLSGSAYASRRIKTMINVTPYEKPKTPGEAQIDISRKLSVGSGNSYGNAPHAGPANSGFSGAGAMGIGGGFTPVGGGASTAAANGEPQLNVKNVANRWGKPAAPVPVPPPAPATSYGGGATSDQNNAGGYSSQAPAPASAPYGYGGGYGSQGQQPQPPPEPEKHRELTEKEKMAAALFGGIVPSSHPAPTPPRPFIMGVNRTAPSSRGPAPKSAPAPPTKAPLAPSTAPPAPEVDLLDFSFGDARSTTNAASPSTGLPLDVNHRTPPETTSAPVSAPAPMSAPLGDPFASEGLLGGFSDAQLSGLPPSSKFQYSGKSMAPLPISTAQFGQMWGGCSNTNPVSVTSGKITSLQQLMELFVKAGAHPVEKIVATNEGIAAGSVGGTSNTLVHGKVQSHGGGLMKIDIIVKSTDADIGGALATFLGTMLR